MYNPSYITQRQDILSVLPENPNKVLDVGCSNGALGQALKDRYPECIVWGVEYDQAMGNEASNKLNRVFIDSAEVVFKNELIKEKFNCIIFADILEHLYDPWEVVKKAKELLESNGSIIVSLPNIRYYNAFIKIFIQGKWPYEERGIFDKTHLRYFTRKNIYDLFDHAGLKIVKLKRNFRFLDRKSVLNKASNYLNIPGVREFFTFQYIIVAKKL